MSTNETEVPRLALSSITLDEEDKQSDSAPFKIFISDGSRVHEVYNPDYVSDFFDTLPNKHLRNYSDHNVKKIERLKRSRRGDSGRSHKPVCGDSISGHKNGLPLMAPHEEEMEYEEEIQDSVISQGSKRKLNDYEEEEELQDGGDSCSRHVTDLVLMGPDGDIVPWDYFDVIVHHNTGDRTIDDSHFKNSYASYLTGSPADPSDTIGTWRWHDLDFLNSVCLIRPVGPFGSLSLNFIVFRDSRLVTVDVKFFLEGEGIVGVGPDEKKNNATTESSFICGKLSFHNSAYDDAIGVLLKTPEDKGIKVAHGDSIRLLRNKFAVPVCKFFTVEVRLKDPVTNSVFKGPVKFAFDSFCEEKGYVVSEKLVGRGAKIEVNVTMLPNDVDALGGV